MRVHLVLLNLVLLLVSLGGWASAGPVTVVYEWTIPTYDFSEDYEEIGWPEDVPLPPIVGTLTFRMPAHDVPWGVYVLPSTRLTATFGNLTLDVLGVLEATFDEPLEFWALDFFAPGGVGWDTNPAGHPVWPSLDGSRAENLLHLDGRSARMGLWTHTVGGSESGTMRLLSVPEPRLTTTFLAMLFAGLLLWRVRPVPAASSAR